MVFITTSSRLAPFGEDLSVNACLVQSSLSPLIIYISCYPDVTTVLYDSVCVYLFEQLQEVLHSSYPYTVKGVPSLTPQTYIVDPPVAVHVNMNLINLGWQRGHRSFQIGQLNFKISSSVSSSIRIRLYLHVLFRLSCFRRKNQEQRTEVQFSPNLQIGWNQEILDLTVYGQWRPLFWAFSQVGQFVFQIRHISKANKWF